MSAPSNRLAELGSEVSSSLERARLENDAASRVREKLVAREVPRLRTAWRQEGSARLAGLRNARFAIVATLTLAATVAITGFFAWPREKAPQSGIGRSTPGASALSFVVGEKAHEEPGATGKFIAAPVAAAMPVTFSDGSSLRLAPAARLRVVEVGRNGARVLVESGSVEVSVVHRDETKWAVEAGPFEVRVTGTKFELAYDPSATGLVVKMREGSVFVRGCGLPGDEGRRLANGEELVVSCKDRSAKIGVTDSPAPEPGTQVSSLPNAPPAPTSAPALPTPSAMASATATTSSTVVELARKGAHADALSAAEASGFDATCNGLSGPDLLLLADAARYAGRFDRAVEALSSARRRFSGSDAAATAAFELGRIAMDIQHELGPAGDHFETYLRERPNGTLAREALGRALEARHRAGDSTRAERLAVRYLTTWPDGPHAKLARKLSAADQAAP
jgi:transmembrane sensor